MSEQPFYTQPFFWAFISMLGLALATSLFTKHKYRRSIILVSIALVFTTIGRVVIVLPFCAQPRLELAGWNWIVGGIVFIFGLMVSVGPLFQVKWWEAPKDGMTLKKTGIYGFVRHPIYLCEVLWFLGWSIIFQSVYGLALVPVWWFVFWTHTLAEEGELIDILGEDYKNYMKEVKGRIFPGLPL